MLRHEQRQALAQWPEATNKRADSKAERHQLNLEYEKLLPGTYADGEPYRSLSTSVVPFDLQ
jgi:hypothetical protein